MKKYLVTLVALVVLAATAFAHEGMQHVMGTVRAVATTSITVKSTDGKTQVVTVTATTKYSRSNQAAKLEDVKIGEKVVIHATAKNGRLIAAEVQLGAAMSRNMKGMKM